MVSEKSQLRDGIFRDLDFSIRARSKKSRNSGYLRDQNPDLNFRKFLSVKYLKIYIPKARKIPNLRDQNKDLKIGAKNPKIPKIARIRPYFLQISEAVFAILIPEIWDFYHERAIPIISHLWCLSMNTVKQ